MEGRGRLDFIYKESRRLFLEGEFKVPEFFLLATSIIIVYLSTIQRLDFLFVITTVSFFIVISLAIKMLWFLREIHREVTSKTSEKLDQIGTFLIEKDPQKIKEMMKIDTSKITLYRNKFLRSEHFCNTIFIFGLFCLLSIQTWWELVPNLYKNDIGTTLLTVFLVLFFIYNRKYIPSPKEYFQNLKKPQSK